VWAGPAGSHAISAGADVLRVTGEANEDFLLSGGSFQNRRITGGDQVLFGVFAQDRIRLDDRWQIQGGARLDVWRNSDGFRRIMTIADMDVSVDSVFDDRSEVRLSENVGVTFTASDRVSLRGGLYTGLRVPTLNELYKPFRAAGGVVTEANADLEPERVLGAEIGVDLDLADRGLLRLTGFWARVSDAILDATIGVAETPGPIAPCGFVPAGGICRQRSNLGTIRSLGLEAELDLRLQGAWRLGGTYELNPTEITDAPGRPDVVGNRSQGSPVHRAQIRFGHVDARILEAVVTGRYLGTRFDDDLNEAEIDDSFLFDIRVRRTLTGRIELFGSVQNLFDTAAEVSRDRDGFVRVTSPRAATAGLRFRTSR
jgi:outer membrane receptor protein involved in Fe transport